jgi:hypothetical protein
VHGTELRGVPILDRAQNELAIAGGYVATIFATQLHEHVNRRAR